MSRWLIFAAVIVGALALGPPTRTLAQSPHPSSGCQITSGPTSSQLPKVTAQALAPAGVVQTGEPVEVRWSFAPLPNRDCHYPLYLVFSTNSRVRFEGDKILALPPGAPGPFGMTYATDRTRVLIPLHQGERFYSGSFSVKIYEAGQFSFNWALVELSGSTNATSGDYVVRQLNKLDGTNLTAGYEVVGGNPTVVVRDQFSTNAPQKTIVSDSGEFLLQSFDRFYRVLDSKTSELVLERSGWDPNFSPSGRFLGAFADGPGFEVIDLYSGTVIASQAQMNKEKGFAGSVHLAAWARRDSVLALSVWGYGGVEIQQTLIDESGRDLAQLSCHACQGFAVDLLLDVNSSLVVAQGQDFYWASLIEKAVGTDTVQKLALKQIPDQGDNDVGAGAFEKREALIAALSKSQLTDLMSAAFSSYDKVSKRLPIDSPSWKLGDPHLQLSHSCSWEKTGQCAASTGDDKEARREISYRKSLRVEHRVVLDTPEHGDNGLLAEGRTFVLRAQAHRGLNTPEEAKSLWRALHRYTGVDVEDPGMIRPTVFKAKDYDGTNVSGDIRRTIPSAAERFQDSGDDVSDAFYGADNEASQTDPKWIEEAWQWNGSHRTNWLIHSYYSMGASSRYWLYLLRDDGYGGNKFVDLSSRLKFKVGRNPSGLDAKGVLETTDERASTYGLGSWPSTIDKINISYDRYLIASGYWLGAGLRWLLVYDLSSDKIIFFNRDMPDASAVSEYRITRDGQLVLQANNNGALYIFHVLTGAQVLRGVFLDDELVVFDSKGYYMATPEGAQFVFLKFPGQPGYHSLRQFAKSLSRPDVIKGDLIGQSDPHEPHLTVPPQISITAEAAGANGSRPTRAHIEAFTPGELRTIRVFFDGRRSKELSASGNHFTADIAIPESREYWLTVVAVDTKGYESVAKSVSLKPSNVSADGRLFVVGVGTDSYLDQRIPQLNFARSDAKRIISAVTNSKTTYYRSVSATEIYDATALRRKLSESIRNISSIATDRDTLMLFVAGHGLRANGEFYLVAHDTKLDNLAETAVAWSDIASALRGTSARVVVLLDACQSGAAANVATNDDAVQDLISNAGPITVIAASKGGQSSIEQAGVGGGVFTTALVHALTDERSKVDTNHNGVVEVAEIYASIKRAIVPFTGGKQTPWLARNDMVGEIPLF
jgi:hypothetical protein